MYGLRSCEVDGPVEDALREATAFGAEGNASNTSRETSPTSCVAGSAPTIAVSTLGLPMAGTRLIGPFQAGPPALPRNCRCASGYS